MFADPQSITVAGSAKSMPRMSSKDTSSVYQTQDGNWKLMISHKVQGEKIRTVARFDQRIIAADPISAVNDFAFNTWYIVNERPTSNVFTATQVSDQVTGFKTWLDATALGKLFGMES
jgi:hypothetical protein